MGKLLNFLDKYILKIGISFLIAFIALYPKLPSINIHGTWVYIRLEDFFIAFVVILWLIQLFRKKVSLSFKLAIPFGAYWMAGLVSLIFSIIVIAPLLSNFYPTVAVLSYLRRIEYMILFFVAFSTIKSIKDVRDYSIILLLTLFGVIIYGFGQRLYIIFWQLVAPLHITEYFFCFPSFQTGNEEFAKGIPLCLSAAGRVTSTFAGHYDLSAYLVLIIPILITFFFVARRKLWKLALFLLSISSLILLNLTASRVSFLAYLMAGMATLILIKKKIFIPAFLIISFLILITFSQSTAKRFMQTFGFASVVIDSQGHIVGEEVTDEGLGEGFLANQVDENLPRGTGYLGLPQLKKEKTNLALVKSNLTAEEARRLQLENGGVELSTVSGNFSVKKVLVYDISFTTRFQAEWPRAIEAFSQNYLLGSGFATITLATDNDYLRLLGETGLLGFFMFISIFIILAIAVKDILPSVESKLVKAFILGLVGGTIGLLLNASLIDVFESSKLAETLWMLLGIGVGGLFLYKKKEVDYKNYFKKILTSSYFIFTASIVFYIAAALRVTKIFFIGDDFIWLKWAASSTVSDISKYFTDAQGFFYRPIDKTIYFIIYSLFGFTPAPFHIFILMLHLGVGISTYILAKRFFKNRGYAAIAALIFLILPSQAENIFWISSLSSVLSIFFVSWGLIFFIKFRERKNLLLFAVSLALGALSLLSYEIGIVYFGLIILIDLYLFKAKISLRNFLLYSLFFALDIAYVVIRVLTNSLSSGGDYSYNLVHFIPNTIGNFLGYLGIFLFGEHALPVYMGARDSLKTEGLLVFAFIFIATIALVAVLFLNKKRLLRLYGNKHVKFLAFCLVFIFISLLPFLGLGNIAFRYSYLAAIPFSIAASFILVELNRKLKYKYALISLVFIVSAYCLVSLSKLYDEWNTAGKITNRTLSYLKLYYPAIPSKSTLYFVNVPIKYQNAWAFPVGLEQGVWFIYQDDSIKIIQAASLEDVEKMKASSRDKSYIFHFDKDYKMEALK